MISDLMLRIECRGFWVRGAECGVSGFGRA